MYIWCVGEVVKVADGKTKRSAQCKTSLPWGAVRIRWPHDATTRGEGETFLWSVLKPADFAKERHLGWRYAASALEKIRQATGERQRCEG